jgi:hypothetical protein
MSLSTGILSYWNLNGNANDYIGSYNGTPTNITWSAGKIGQGASYETNSSAIRTNNFSFPATFSISAWINSSSLSSPVFGKAIFGQWYYTTSEKSALLWIDTTSAPNKFNFIISSNGSASTSIQSITTPVNGSWYFVTATYDGSVMRLYINGLLEAQINYGGGVYPANKPIEFGTYDSQAFYAGLLDEVGLWNRAITQEEVTILYNTGSGITYPFPSFNNGNFFQFF